MKAKLAITLVRTLSSAAVICAIGASLVYQGMSGGSEGGSSAATARETGDAFATACAAMALEGDTIVERARKLHSSPTILAAIEAFSEGFPPCAAHPVSLKRAVDCVAGAAAKLDEETKPLRTAWSTEQIADVCAKDPDDVNASEKAARAMQEHATELALDSEITQSCIGQVSQWLDSRGRACAETDNPEACLLLLENAIQEYGESLRQAERTGAQADALIRELEETSGRVLSVSVMFAIRCDVDG